VVNWYEMTMMTEEIILPPNVSWREFADHCLTHDPLPEVPHGSEQELPGVQAEQPHAALHLHVPLRCALVQGQGSKQGCLAQLVRALPRQGRGQWFEPTSAHG
jgi:hypothetical protein